MAVYETTATMIQDTAIHSNSANTPEPQPEASMTIGNSGAVIHLGLFSWLIPSKPTGADEINRVTAILAFRSRFAPGPSAQRSQTAYKITRPWTEASASYNYFDGVGNAWTTVGGDKDSLISSTKISGSPTYGATFSWDVTSVSEDWGKRGNILIQDSAENASAATSTVEWFGESVATVAWKPHVVVNFTDNAPDAINDLTVSPDVSLPEASSVFRTRAVLNWTASNANDFSRYRIRRGKNSVASIHTHKTFISSRGSTTYLDEEDYTNGSTIFYSMYTEDSRNRSASTNANVSNVVSWSKPRITNANVTIYPATGADVLTQFRAYFTTDDMTRAKKVKVWWGDGVYSFTQTLSDSGSSFAADHRYSKATTIVTIRNQAENIDGFRSGRTGTETRIITNPGPIAKIVASPSRQRTAGTFSFGFGPSSGTQQATGFILLNTSSASPGDGIITRFKTRSSSASGDFYAQLWRLDGAAYRCIYSYPFTTESANASIYRTVNWRTTKGDLIGIQLITGEKIGNYVAGSGDKTYAAAATAVSPGNTIHRLRFAVDGNGIVARAHGGMTNPIHFSAKDSFARGSNRFINRFRWDTDYNGTFGVDFNTEATTSFYYAWTTATTQFVAVRAVDNTHASSIDIAGVVVETEATFRFPDDLRDGVNAQIRDSRSRAYTQSYALSKDYGTLDLGALGPRSLALSGTAYSKATSSTSYIDIDRVHGVFPQRKRCYVQLPGKSTSSAVQGYVVDAPNIYSTDDPDAAGWDLTIVVAT